MSDELGRITFFEVERLGFYQYKDQEDKDSKSKRTIKQSISEAEILDNLFNWVNGNSFENTLPLIDDERLKKKVFCRNAYKCNDSGDYFFVLWKSELDGNGNIQGVDASASVSSSVSDIILLQSEQRGGKKYIWGKPCYYWYISSLNKFASIKFPHSDTDTYLFARYIRDYVNFRMEYSGRKVSDVKIDNASGRKIKYQTVTFEADDNSGRVKFLFDYKMFMKKANQESLRSRRSHITHTVIRDTIGANVSDSRAWWSKMMDSIPGFKSDKPNLRKQKEIELVLEGAPSEEEMEELYEFYEDGFTLGSSWNNIGFKEGGRSSQPKWLDQYVLRETVSAPYSAAAKQHISAEVLAQLINAKRELLVLGLQEDEQNNFADSIEEESLAAARG